MATRPQYSLSTSVMKILFCSPFFLLFISCFPRKNQASKIQFNTLDISRQLSMGSTCDQASNKAGRLNDILEIIHSYGPCAPKQVSNKTRIISLTEILINDQLRVQSIQARWVANTTNQLHKSNKQTKLPALSWDIGNYIVTIGFGTPTRNLTLIFDTASDLTWTQCLPCLVSCYEQNEPIFNPSSSTTYLNISCDSTECLDMAKKEGSSQHCYNKSCTYGEIYADDSFTRGLYSRDTLTITPTHVFPDFMFGCGQNNDGSFGLSAGLLGMGRGSMSFVSQTATKVFSYCLPWDISSKGFLTLGKHCNESKNTVVFTPLVQPPRGNYQSTFYYIEITSISVGGTRLRIRESVFKTAGAIIDSDTTITRLPPMAYNAVKSEFKKKMIEVQKYKILQPFSIFDTCFHITNITNIWLPTMSFTFKGNATLDLDPSGILRVVNSTLACLAFAGNKNPTDLAIFGNTQQRKFEVVYDVAGKKLGFRSNPNCVYE